jgi:hypothetical protein
LFSDIFLDSISRLRKLDLVEGLSSSSGPAHLFDDSLEYSLTGDCFSFHALVKPRSKRSFLPKFLFSTKKLNHGAFWESCPGTGLRMTCCEPISNMPPLRMETSTVEPLKAGRLKLEEDIMLLLLQNAVQKFIFTTQAGDQCPHFIVQTIAQSCILRYL